MNISRLTNVGVLQADQNAMYRLTCRYSCLEKTSYVALRDSPSFDTLPQRHLSMHRRNGTWEVPGGNPALTQALQVYKWGQRGISSKILFDRTGNAVGFGLGYDPHSTRSAGVCEFQTTREGKEGATALEQEMTKLG